MRGFGMLLVLSLTACGSSSDHNAQAGGQAGSDVQGSGGSAATGGSVATGGRVNGGGATATGGNKGTGGTVTVTACDGLPTAGQWQDITPTVFHTPSNMETLAVVVDQRDQSVYAAAGNKTNGGNEGTGVYKSTDCGATWNLVTTGTNADKLMSGDPWAMLIDPTNPDILYTNNGYGNDPTIYKSTNKGVDWTALWPDPTWKQNSSVQAIAMESANPQHLAVCFHQNCDPPNNGLCLSRSNDGGATWKVFDGPSQLTGWQEAATVTVLGPTSYLYAATSGGWYTADEGQTWAKVVSDTFYGSYAGSTTLAPNGTMYLAGASTLYQSNSDPIGKTWTAVSGTHTSTVIIHDDVSLYASWSWAYGGNPVWMAKLSDTSNWTNMTQSGRGANQLAYDESHHIVYAANWANGLWRLVTH